MLQKKELTIYFKILYKYFYYEKNYLFFYGYNKKNYKKT